MMKKMKFISWKLFLNSQEYRKIWIRKKIAIFKYNLKKPFVWVIAVYKVIKRYRDYPDRWERYVEEKKDEQKIEMYDFQEAKLSALIEFIAEVTNLDIALALHCSYKNSGDVTSKEYENIYVQFSKAKENLKNFSEGLEKYGVNIPEEFKVMIEEAEIDKFKEINEYQSFSNKLHSYMEQLINEVQQKVGE